MKEQVDDTIGNVDEMIEVGIVERALPVVLTDEELLTYGQELSQAHKAHESLAEKKKAETQRLTALMKGEANNMSRCANIIATGKINKPVSVKTTKDFRMGTLTEVRQDTGEVLFQRPMTQAERQRGLTLK